MGTIRFADVEARLAATRQEHLASGPRGAQRTGGPFTQAAIRRQRRPRRAQRHHWARERGRPLSEALERLVVRIGDANYSSPSAFSK
ncbi:MAG: hypothetical protein QM756_34940 [Polyangiaceae bacterium]